MPPDHTAAEEAVLARIRPGRLPKIVEQTLDRVRDALLAAGIDAAVMMGGSTAKGTYLSGDHDIDVFVRFPRDIPTDGLSDRLEPVLREVFGSVERVHGSRDYFHVLVDEYTFEFIPVLQASSWEEAANVTDMSPLHVEYVTAHLRRRPWLADEIRLTKQFCKAAKVYGAESYIGGFSGHVIDLLNIHYGGFRKLLEAAAQWGAKVVIDPEGHLVDPMRQMDRSKTAAPLVIVDPVQRDRNSAAAVARPAFDALRERARAYLEAPEAAQEPFFTLIPLSADELRRAHPGARILRITAVPRRGKRDVVGAKCYKAFQYCVQQLARHGFPLLESRWEFGEETVFLFALRQGELPAEEEVGGPPVHRTMDAARFQEKHETTYVRAGRLHALERRRFRDPLDLLAWLITQPYVRERVQDAKAEDASG